MIAAFRMYEATPGAAAAWRALFERVLVLAEVEAAIVEHRPPAPIAELWSRQDLACGFMCGLPFVRAHPAMQAIAAPVPSPSRYAGMSRYCSEFLVRADSGHATLEDTFGGRFGWMAADSQSGFNAPLASLAGLVSSDRPELYAQWRGPLGAPASTLDALLDHRVDVIALDSFWLDLVRHHAPERLAGVRCVATTPWTPMPLLAAAPGIPAEVVRRLQDVLLVAHEEVELAPLLPGCLVRRFVVPDLPAYPTLEKIADRARDLQRLARRDAAAAVAAADYPRISP